MSELLSVLNPEGYPPKIVARGLAPEIGDLANKRVFLVDIGWENSDEFMVQLQASLHDHHPELETEVVRWKDQHQPDPDLSAQIQREGDAAILGVGL